MAKNQYFNMNLFRYPTAKWNKRVLIFLGSLTSFLLFFQCSNKEIPLHYKGVRFNYIYYFKHNPDSIFYSSIIIMNQDSGYKCSVYQELPSDFNIEKKNAVNSLYEVTPVYVQFSVRAKTINFFLIPNYSDIINNTVPKFQDSSTFIVIDSIKYFNYNNGLVNDTCIFLTNYFEWGKFVNLYSPKLKMVIKQLGYHSEGNFNFITVCELKSYSYIY